MTSYRRSRTPITTVAIPDTRRHEIIDRVAQRLHNRGRQAYWVCTLIEEVRPAGSAGGEATGAQAGVTGLNIGTVRGRMKPAENRR
ncbi:hypothetical protein KCP75_19895 [Salmonella enterica subsp. enterica]|nr:hypothetical protein KCP75_19895 [Salmonella enterica subsp. enterica]